jgi:beta-amylase
LAVGNKTHYAGVPLTGENALQRYDHTGLRRIRESALADRCGGIRQLTFLRMGNLMFDHWGSFTHLVSELSHDDAG